MTEESRLMSPLFVRIPLLVSVEGNCGIRPTIVMVPVLIRVPPLIISSPRKMYPWFVKLPLLVNWKAFAKLKKDKDALGVMVMVAPGSIIILVTFNWLLPVITIALPVVKGFGGFRLPVQLEFTLQFPPFKV